MEVNNNNAERQTDKISDGNNENRSTFFAQCSRNGTPNLIAFIKIIQAIMG